MAAKPKTKLNDLTIGLFGMVDAGDNPGAHMTMAKNKPDSDPDPEHEGEGDLPAPGLAQKLRRWVVQKFEPRTTRQILAERQFHDDFWKLRSAFQQSIHQILDLAPSDEMSKLMATTTKEFVDEAKALADRVTKGHPEERDRLLDILKGLLSAVDQPTAKARSEFEKRMAELAAFEPPQEADPENTVKNIPTKLADAIKDLPADKQDAIKAAYEAEQTSDDDDGDAGGGEGGDKTGKAKDKPAADPISKDGLPDAVAKALEAMEKRVEASEKRTEAAEEETRKLRDEARKSSRIEKVKKLGVTGVPYDDVAEVMAVLEEAGGETAAKLEKTLRALAAQTKKGRAILKVVGDSGSDDGEAPEVELEKRIKELRKEFPTLTYEKAYAEVLDQDPDLYAAIDEAEDLRAIDEMDDDDDLDEVA